MIQLTRLNNTPFYLNAELIEHIESIPDTVIALAGGQKYRVAEGAEEVVRRVVEYRRRVVKAAANPAAGMHAEEVQDDGRTKA
jgi:flagellar protein FlbD